VAGATPIGADVTTRHAAAHQKCKAIQPVSAESCTAWGKSLDLLRNLTNMQQDFDRHTKTAEQTKVVASVTLLDAYTSVGLAQLSVFAWDDQQAESDKLRIGTQYGFGNAFMSPFRDGSDNDSFSDLTLKFYRHPVDKSLPDPYFGNRGARLSLAFGIVRGDLHHQGQKLSAFAGGVSPTLGAAWDVPGLRDVAVHGGFVFFRQPSGNPAAGDATTVHAAPFVSLGFDFDAANRLSKLLTP
jgi:hypothetical protein